MFAFLEKLAPTVIAIEACGASHHCARLLQSFGHSVKLIAPSAGQAALSTWELAACASASRWVVGWDDESCSRPLCRLPAPAEIISHAVWLYFRFPLGLRMVEELLVARASSSATKRCGNERANLASSLPTGFVVGFRGLATNGI
jgi:hypothetical protein